ncbi:MAG: hypothetical protein ABSA83_01790 [Verrucomicrobiota bacterium]|jgi:hypothetical protein
MIFSAGKLSRLIRVAALAGWLAAAGPLAAQSTWQVEFAKMPLTEKVSELNRHNCVKVMLASFQRNPAVKALIFMPGATDEFYFFRRARAALTNSAPTLLDAVCALTNQTYIRATLNPPFLLLRTDEDPLEPIVAIQDQRTAERLRKKHFEKHGVFNDRDWDFMQPMLAFDLDTKMLPALQSHESHHFFRHSFAEYDLQGWDALRAVALAGKTAFTVCRKKVVFSGDTRVKAPAVPPSPEFLQNKTGD